MDFLQREKWSQHGDAGARQRIRQIFQYLKALHQHRSPPKLRLQDQLWFRWFSDLPKHPTIEIGDRDDLSEYVLRVGRPRLTSAPKLPEVLQEWVEEGREDPAKPLRFRDSLEHLGEYGERESVSFESDPRRVDARSKWEPQRTEWAHSEKPAREAMKVFEALFDLWGRIQRESEQVELVLGDGVLRWSRAAGDAYHPILLQRVELEFDAEVPEFRVIEASYPVEFYESAFPPGDDLDAGKLREFKNELEKGSFHPLAGKDTSAYLKSIAVRLSARGDFVESRPTAPKGGDPVIGRDPVIFLRSRSQGFTQTIEHILEALERGDAVPPSLSQVVGIESAPPDEPPEPMSGQPETRAPLTDVLFSKLANPEQFRIAQRLASHDAVLVQGPPGTGKSHTIANLVGHLLAEGKSILVTSHTTKALRVLRGHVVESLRPLCVSVLERDSDSRQQLEEAVSAIVSKLDVSDKETLTRDGQRLRADREKLLVTIREVENGIRRARESEYEPIAIGGESISASEAARWLRKEKERCAWIPGPVVLGSPLPLPTSEIEFLYRSNELLTPQDERECREQLPDPTSLMPPNAMRKDVARLIEAQGKSFEFGDSYWQSTESAANSETFRTLLADLEKAVEPLGEDSRWRLAAIEASSRPGGSQPWETLIRKIRNTANAASRFAEADLQFEPRLPSSFSVEESRTTIAEIQDHVRRKGKLPWAFLMSSKWRALIQESRVKGRSPSKLEHFRALSNLTELTRLRTELRERWNRQVASLGGPSGMELGRKTEESASQFIPSIETALTWQKEIWSPLQARLHDVGFDWEAFLGAQPPKLEEHGALRRIRQTVYDPLKEIFEARELRLWHDETLKKFEEQGAMLKVLKGSAAAELAEALSSREPSRYKTAYARAAELVEKREISEKRAKLLDAIRPVAASWADSIASRRGAHSAGAPPGDPRDAWKWRQIADELEDRAGLDERALADELERRQRDLRQVSSDLIETLAWAGQLARTGHKERQALVGWADTIRRIGKGTGKRVPRLRAAARRLMSEARSAVPVWIMPISRAVENFDPLETKFDVIIVDEASQSDVLGLSCLFMGKKVLVVGDHEQVSPSAVGQKLDVVENLITAHLDGIPNKHLYDGKYSIYDVARASFGSAIRLVEHFRCVPEIIDFSNWLSYKGEIKPLRDPSTVDLWPSVVEFFVEGGRVENKINQREAEITVALIVAAAEQPEYADKSLGVISLVGAEQAQTIDRILEREMPISEYKRRRLLCGNAASFQGDERDVMFLSMVDAPADGPLSLRDTTSFRQRFNVAASRAKDQMWLVHSLRPEVDLKPGDLRKRLIDYVRDPNSRERATERAQARTESDLEKKVIERLIAAGFRLKPQVSVGYYRIDIVVYGNDARVAIECDGDRYHPVDKIPEDMARQAILERLGWRFVRIRGSAFYRNPDDTMESVLGKLGELGVEPLGEELEGRGELRDEAGEELKARVVRRAYELIREWKDAEIGITA